MCQDKGNLVKLDGAAPQEQACGRIGFDLTRGSPRNKILITTKIIHDH
ncbi:MAG: hypothetical protein PHP98_05955 [Kiritimatiellae bacterium]|nr:hypothetical protein [Kiritimatiellia bacterium]